MTLSEYVVKNFDKFGDLEENTKRGLKQLLLIWNADYIDIEKFKRQFDLSESASIHTILTFMCTHLKDKMAIRYGEDCYIDTQVAYMMK